LQTQGLTWAHFMVHLLGASECLAPMCDNARKRLESVLIGKRFGWPVWGGSRELTLLWIELNITSQRRFLTVVNHSYYNEKDVHTAIDLFSII
jgi:hypothetical protein